jgi:hypothetical protein
MCSSGLKDFYGLLSKGSPANHIIFISYLHSFYLYFLPYCSDKELEHHIKEEWKELTPLSHS